jgi:hypothetical protein
VPKKVVKARVTVREVGPAELIEAQRKFAKQLAERQRQQREATASLRKKQQTKSITITAVENGRTVKKTVQIPENATEKKRVQARLKAAAKARADRARQR